MVTKILILFHLPLARQFLYLSSGFCQYLFHLFLFVYLRKVSALFNSSLIAQRRKIFSVQLRCKTIFFTTFSGSHKIRQLYVYAWACACDFCFLFVFALFGTVINFTLGSFRRYLYPLIYISVSLSAGCLKDSVATTITESDFL